MFAKDLPSENYVPNFGNTDNELTISYKYKKTTNTEYIIGTTSIIPTIDGNNFSFNNFRL